MVESLTLYYKRRPNEVDGEYPYEGRVVVEKEGKEVFKDGFIALPFKRLVALVSDVLNAHQGVSRVRLQRTERDDITPMELGDRLIEVLRKDPLTAYRSLLYEPPKSKGSVRKAAKLHDVRAQEFGESVYLPMESGNIRDPETGEWLHLAYGEKQGFRIRKDDNKPNSWFQVELMDTSPEGTNFVERIAFCKWATISVWSLLARQLDKYYLLGNWNKDGPWISYQALKEKLEEHLASKEQANGTR